MSEWNELAGVVSIAEITFEGGLTSDGKQESRISADMTLEGILRSANVIKAGFKDYLKDDDIVLCDMGIFFSEEFADPNRLGCLEYQGREYIGKIGLGRLEHGRNYYNVVLSISINLPITMLSTILQLEKGEKIEFVTTHKAAPDNKENPDHAAYVISIRFRKIYDIEIKSRA